MTNQEMKNIFVLLKHCKVQIRARERERENEGGGGGENISILKAADKCRILCL